MNTRPIFNHPIRAHHESRFGSQREFVLPQPARTVESNTLFRGEREIGIEHHGALYRLKITRQGKLILNK